MLQIINPGLRYEGYDCILPSGQRYRAPTLAALVEKVRKIHPDVSEGWIEADWCRRYPGQCVELPDIPADAPSRYIAYVQAMVARARSGIKVIAPEVYERDRYGICTTFSDGQPCDQFRGEKGIGLISCQACNCRFLKGWSAGARCILNRWKS